MVLRSRFPVDDASARCQVWNSIIPLTLPEMVLVTKKKATGTFSNRQLFATIAQKFVLNLNLFYNKHEG